MPDTLANAIRLEARRLARTWGADSVSAQVGAQFAAIADQYDPAGPVSEAGRRVIRCVMCGLEGEQGHRPGCAYG